MPRCLNCDSIVSKDDIFPHESDPDLTRCSFCSDTDAAEYRFQVSVTNRGLGILGATPHGEFSASVPWRDIKRLRGTDKKKGVVQALPSAKEG